METSNFGFYPRRAIGLGLLGEVVGYFLVMMAGGIFITPLFGDGIAVQTLLFAFWMGFVGAMLGLAETSRRHFLRLAFGAAVGGALGWLTSTCLWQWMDGIMESNTQWWLLFVKDWGGFTLIALFFSAGLGWAVGGLRFSVKLAGYGILAASLGSLISLSVFVEPDLVNPNIKFISDFFRFLLIAGLLGWALGRERPVMMPVPAAVSHASRSSEE